MCVLRGAAGHRNRHRVHVGNGRASQPSDLYRLRGPGDDDVHGRAAATVLARTNALDIRSVDLDAEFPFDDGENTAVTLANDLDAALLLCDEFNQLGLLHASLADTRLVTTPTLLSVFVRTEQLSAVEARLLLDEISDARSWDANSYVQRAHSLLEEP